MMQLRAMMLYMKEKEQFGSEDPFIRVLELEKHILAHDHFNSFLDPGTKTAV